MKIGDRIYVRGYVDEIRKDTVIVRNDGGYFGTILSEVTGELPSAQPERKNGLWKVIRYNGNMQRYARCKCGYEYGAGKFDGLKFVALKLHNFCPNCGAKMEVEEWPDKDKSLLQSPITT